MVMEMVMVIVAVGAVVVQPPHLMESALSRQLSKELGALIRF
jgi:hypothetical protein